MVNLPKLLEFFVIINKLIPPILCILHIEQDENVWYNIKEINKKGD